MADDLNSPVAQNRARTVAYHKVTGRQQFDYSIDAHNAVGRHPNEWAWSPWGAGEKPDPRLAVELPTDWRDLSTQRRRALAQQLGAPATITASHADEMLSGYEEHRAKVDADEAERVARDQPKQPAPEAKGPGVGDVKNPAVDIPENWRDLSADERKALAASLGAPDGVKAKEADEYILSQVQARTGTAGSEKTPLT